MKTLLSVAITLCITQSIYAQQGNLEVGGTVAGSGMTIRYSDAGMIGRKSGAVDYADVRGKYFWDTEWNSGLLLLKAGNGVKLSAVRLNQHTNEVHYLGKDGTEMSTQPGQVKKLILFSPKDSSKVIGMFESIKAPNAKTEWFYEVLNEGKTQLLKKTVVTVKKGSYDPSLGRAEHRFVTANDYFIRDETGLKSLNGFGKSSVFEVVPIAGAAEGWLTSHKNKLKNEEDVLEFLNYINSK